jgi:hypothetical protein
MRMHSFSPFFFFFILLFLSCYVSAHFHHHIGLSRARSLLAVYIFLTGICARARTCVFVLYEDSGGVAAGWTVPVARHRHFPPYLTRNSRRTFLCRLEWVVVLVLYHVLGY